MNESDLFATGAAAVIENAQRSGLTWRLVPGTVVSTSGNVTSISVVVDGDLEPINTQSLMGPIPVGSRVMVLSVPPQGNYIVGWYGGPTIPQLYGYSGAQSVSFSSVSAQTAVITFPNEFLVAPRVVCQVVSPSILAVRATVLVTSVSTTQFAIRVDLTASSTVTVSIHWHAVTDNTT